MQCHNLMERSDFFPVEDKSPMEDDNVDPQTDGDVADDEVSKNSDKAIS